MTVAELIEKLKKCDPSMTARTYDNEYGVDEEVENVYINEGSVVIGGYEGEVV